MGQAAKGYQPLDRDRPMHVSRLGEITHRSREKISPPHVNGLPINCNDACVGLNKPRQGFQQSGLARAVWPDQSDQLTALGLQTHPVEALHAVVRDGEISGGNAADGGHCPLLRSTSSK